MDGFWYHFWTLTFFDVSECKNDFLKPLTIYSQSYPLGWIFFSWLFFFLALDQKKVKKKVAHFWSGSKKITSIFDPDQKKSHRFLIRIKKNSANFWSGSEKNGQFLIRIKKNSDDFWSGSKKIGQFLIQDQKKLGQFLIRIKKKFGQFLIRIKKNSANFWSGSKNIRPIYDPDQKKFGQFLIRIKKNSANFWSGSWLFHDPITGSWSNWIMIHDPPWSMISQLCILYEFWLMNLQCLRSGQHYC